MLPVMCGLIAADSGMCGDGNGFHFHFLSGWTRACFMCYCSVKRDGVAADRCPPLTLCNRTIGLPHCGHLFNVPGCAGYATVSINESNVEK